MKKILLTLSLVALFAGVTKAQEPVKNKSNKKEVVNADGTTSVVEDGSTAKNPNKKEEPKKSGTRMAINEKGTAGTKSNNKTAVKEEKSETANPTSPTTKPH
jgi:hypothetical protein